MDSLAELAGKLGVEPSLLNEAIRDVLNEMNVEDRMQGREGGAPDSPGRSGETPGQQETPPGRGRRPNTE